MGTPTYTPLANITLGSAVSSVSFSSIPATYRDLVVVFNGTTEATGGRNFFMRFNGDSGSNYTTVSMFGNGSTTSSSSATGTAALNVIVDNNRSVAIAQIMDYSATDKHKTVLGRGNVPAVALDARASRWANTAAITSITMLPDSLNWLSGSTFALYAIAS